MAIDGDQQTKSVRRWPLRLYAMVATLFAIPTISKLRDGLKWSNEAQLVIVSPVQIDRVRVTYDDRDIRMRPEFWGAVYGYAVFPGLRTRKFEPVLTVSWQGPSGPVSISRVMRQVDYSVCLYVLTLDSAGMPMRDDRPDRYSPFWWSCSLY